MNLSEFLSQIWQLAESGNWTGIFAMLGTLFATFFASVGGIAGIIGLGKVIFGNKTLFKKINTSNTEIFNNVKTEFSALLNQNKTEITQIYENIIADLKGTVGTLQNKLVNNEINQQAFFDTCLNSKELLLKYENRIKELALQNNVIINEQINETIQDTQQNITQTTNEIKEIIQPILQEATAKKIKKELVAIKELNIPEN